MSWPAFRRVVMGRPSAKVSEKVFPSTAVAPTRSRVRNVSVSAPQPLPLSMSFFTTSSGSSESLVIVGTSVRRSTSVTVQPMPSLTTVPSRSSDSEPQAARKRLTARSTGAARRAEVVDMAANPSEPVPRGCGARSATDRRSSGLVAWPAVAARGFTSGRARLLGRGAGAGPAGARGWPVPPARNPRPPPTPAATGLPAPEPPDPVLDEVEVRRTGAIDRADERLAEARLIEEAATADWLIAESIRQGSTDRAERAAAAVAAAQDRLAEADRAVDPQARRFAELQAVTDRRQAALADEQAQLRTLAAAVFASVPEDRFLGLGTFDEMSVGDRREAIRAWVIDEQTAVVDARSATWRTARAASRAPRSSASVGRSAPATTEPAPSPGPRPRATRPRPPAGRDAEDAAAGASARWTAAAERRTERRDDRREARLTAAVTGTDLTLVALHAYWRASSWRPAGCRGGWWPAWATWRPATAPPRAAG